MQAFGRPMLHVLSGNEFDPPFVFECPERFPLENHKFLLEFLGIGWIEVLPTPFAREVDLAHAPRDVSLPVARLRSSRVQYAL